MSGNNTIADPGDEWEDCGEPHRSPSPPGSRSSGSTSPHARRPGTKAVSFAASPRRYTPAPRRFDRVTSYTSSKGIKAEPLSIPDDWTERSRDLAHAGMASAVRHARDVLEKSLEIILGIVHMMKTPLAVVIAVSFVYFVGSYLAAAMLRPMCTTVPGMSHLALCATPARHAPSKVFQDSPPRWADYPRLVDMQASRLEQLLDHNAGGSSLALEIKKAEMAMEDLAMLVRVSDLTSRGLLADTLVGFVDDAKKTGEDLQRLDAKVNSAVDHIVAVNDFALHQIGAAQAREPSALVRALWPWSGAPQTQEVVRARFEDAMAVTGEAMSRVVVEAQFSLGHLQDLEERLRTLHAIVAREDRALQDGQDELLATLWTKLGRNKKRVKSFERHVQLLGGVRGYRKKALAHVVGTLQTLRGMQADMEELRTRVSGVPIGGDRIPVEVHMRSIQKGLERMQEGRVRAKQLEETAMRKVLGEAE